VWTSLAAWALGSLVLGLALWADHNATPTDEVGAGLAGLGIAIAFGIFLLCTATGVVLGVNATRRAPTERLADEALGLNIVTIVGVSISTVILLA
jgi:hypothetical protein